MEKFLDTFHFLKSRKFWAALGAWLVVLGACLAVDPFPVQEFIEKTTWIWLGYIGTVAFEDGMAKRADVHLGKPTIETPVANITIKNDDFMTLDEFIKRNP